MHMLSPLQTFTIEGLYSLFRGDREVNWKDEDSIQDQFLSSVDGQAMSKQLLINCARMMMNVQ